MHMECFLLSTLRIIHFKNILFVIKVIIFYFELSDRHFKITALYFKIYFTHTKIKCLCQTWFMNPSIKKAKTFNYNNPYSLRDIVERYVRKSLKLF